MPVFEREWKNEASDAKLAAIAMPRPKPQGVCVRTSEDGEFYVAHSLDEVGQWILEAGDYALIALDVVGVPPWADEAPTRLLIRGSRITSVREYRAAGDEETP